MENIPMYKAILVGEVNTGKTCIIRQFVENKFDNFVKPTYDQSISTKVIKLNNGKFIKLCIWDTSGQERFRSINKIFYHDAKIVIFVYDITSRKTFDEIKSFWQKEVTESNPDACNFLYKFLVYGLAANKSDLYDKSTVSEDEARRFAREINAVFSSTSALVNSGITELYAELAEKVTSSQKKEKENKKLIIDAKKKKGGCCHSKKEKKRVTLLSEGNDC